MRKHDASIELGEKQTPHVLAFIKGGSLGLTMSDRVKSVPIAASVSAIIISFIGLGFAATEPNYKVQDSFVWAFSVYSLAICPAFILGYEKWLSFLERETIARWAGNEDKAAEMAETFKMILEAGILLDDVNPKLNDIQRKKEIKAMDEFNAGVHRMIDTIAGAFRALWAFILRTF